MVTLVALFTAVIVTFSYYLNDENEGEIPSWSPTFHPAVLATRSVVAPLFAKNVNLVQMVVGGAPKS